MGHVNPHTKFGPDRFSRFDVSWTQTDRQTDKQSIYIDIILSGAYLGIFFFRGGGRGSESTPIGTQRNPRNYRFHGSRRESPHSPPPLCTPPHIILHISSWSYFPPHEYSDPFLQLSSTHRHKHIEIHSSRPCDLALNYQ